MRKAAFKIFDIAARINQSLRAPRVVVYFSDTAAFGRKARAIADLLQRHGFDTRIEWGISHVTRLKMRTSSDLWIGFWNHVSLHWLPRAFVAINAEPVQIKTSTLNHSQLLGSMQRAMQVWNYSSGQMNVIQSLGVPVRFVPFGYAPYYETSYHRHTKGKNLPQDIDVLFYGSLSPRRRNALMKLADRGMKVRIIDTSSPVSGEALDELIARSKIVLGIHYYDQPEAQIVDFARIDHLLSNQIFVIHERPSSLAQNDNEFEENLTTCHYGELTDICAYFLANSAERETRSKKASAWFKARWSLEKFIPFDDVRQLLQQLNQESRSIHRAIQRNHPSS